MNNEVGSFEYSARINTSQLAKDGAKADNIVQDVGSKIEKTGERSAKGFGKLGAQIGVVSGVVSTVLDSAIATVSDSINSAINRVDTLNNASRTFANMGFAVEDVTKVMDDLDKSIKGLPTPIDAAVKGVQMLAGATQDIDKSQKIFAALNNAILGFGGNANDVNGSILQLSQAFAGGVIDATTWNSMLENNLGPALNAIAKDMGITTASLKKGLSEGTISVEEFQDALIKMNKQGGGGLASFEKIAKDATSGIGTGMSNAQTAVTRGVAKIIEAIGSTNISNAISGVGKAFEMVLKGVASGVATTIGIINNLGTEVSDIISNIKSGNFEEVGRIVGQGLKTGIESAIKAISIGVDSIRNFFGSINFVEVGEFIVKKIIPGIAIGLVAGLGNIDIVEDILKPLGDNILPVLLGILSIALAPAKLLNPMIKIFSKIPIVGALIKFIVNSIRGGLKPIRDAFGSLFQGAGGVVKGFIDRLGVVFSTITNLLLAPWRMLVDNIAIQIRLIPQTIVGTFNSLVAMFRSLGSFITNIVKGTVGIIKSVFSPLTSFFKGLFDGFTSVAGGTVSNIGDYFSVLYIRIVSNLQRLPAFMINVFGKSWMFITKIFGNASQWFTDKFKGAVNGIKSVFGTLTGFFRGIWDNIISMFGKVGTKVGDVIGNAFRSVINTVLNGAVGIINGFIDAINGAVDVINEIPGVNIGRVARLGVPQLATGGIVTSPTLAMIGEGRESEAVIPLSKLDDMINGDQRESGPSLNLTVNMSGIMTSSPSDERAVAKRLIERFNEELRAKGIPEVGKA